MGKLIIFKIGHGNFNEGFDVTLEIGEEGKRPTTNISGRLPANPEISLQYKDWQQIYRSLGGQRRISGEAQQITEVSPELIERCGNLAEALKSSLKAWFDSKEFRPLQNKLLDKTTQNEEIRVVIQTKDGIIQRLPWHLWEFFDDRRQAEVVLSSPEYDQVEVVSIPPKTKVRILAILGNSEGIDVEKDRQQLEQLPKAETCFLVEPTRQKLHDKLHDQQWDILFFAGHSDSQGMGEIGQIYLNRTDSLLIGDLSNALRKAIEKGLKLAIFNSCDGLGLARTLENLQIPQVIVMREPVPDSVAQEFLKYFLAEFADGQPLHIAARQARERLQGIEDRFLYATWLPAIFQNSAQAPQYYRDLLNDDLILKRRISLGLAAIVIIIFIVLYFNKIIFDTFNLTIISFMSASFSSISAFIFLSDFRLQRKSLLTSKILKFACNLFLFLFVFFVFSKGLPSSYDPNEARNEGFKGIEASHFPGEYSQREPISFRHLTGINEYPTLSFLEPIIPKKLTTILGIDNTPIIHTDNPIFESLDKFKIETGNESLITRKYHPKEGINIGYAINQAGRTNRGEVAGEGEAEHSDFFQERKDFEKDTVKYDSEMEFKYQPILMPIQTSLENASWTSVLVEQTHQLKGEILQYPKLSDVEKFGVQDKLAVNTNQLNDVWTKKVIHQNPNNRGFLFYSYQYLQSLSDEFSSCGNIGTIIRIAPSPYIRFLDIENIINQPISIELMNYKLLKNTSYQLTAIDQRDLLFQHLPTKNKLLRVKLLPKEHLFIPIEFGFDTRSQKKFLKFKAADYIQDRQLDEMSNKTLYIVSPPNDLLLKNEKNGSIKLSQKEINKLSSNPIILYKNFLASTTSLEKLVEKIPNRFAVGSIIDIVSLKINGKSVPIGSPINEPSFSMSAYFASGSCPFLQIFNSKKGYWSELGTVLYGRHTKSLQDYEFYNLGNDVSKIKLEERDREISYIDSLSILYTDEGTKTMQEVRFNIPEIFEEDGKYFILHQGESLEIDLKPLIPENATNLKLKINGYYEIFAPETPKMNFRSNFKLSKALELMKIAPTGAVSD